MTAHTKKSHNARLRKEYISRINRVIDYIDANIESPLSLEQLSRIANFSSFHFHRVFSGIMGEPLNRFIQRIRLEKAAAKLRMNPDESITAIAYECGFSGSAAFARAFKEHFGMSASAWRTLQEKEKSKAGKTKSKGRKTNSNNRKALTGFSSYSDAKLQKGTRRNQMMENIPLKVEVKQLPKMTVAYVRHIGPYKGDSALFDQLFTRLFKWAGPRNLCRTDETTVLSVYHDNPEITAEDRLRVSVGITVPEDTRVDGEVGKMTLSAGKYAVARFEIRSSEFENAWNAVYGRWLPESGYQPDDRPALEICRNDPREHPQNLHIVDICVPMKPL
jgi:AraC family transcriptional regulator